MSPSASPMDRRTDGSPNVRWIRPESTSYSPTPLPGAGERSERTAAMIVMVLTLACTALAIFDLYLLAAGVS
jgi:hypothetical protein